MSYNAILTDRFVSELVNTMTLGWNKDTLKSVKYIGFSGLRDDGSTACEGSLDVKDVKPEGAGLLFIAEGYTEYECNVATFTVRNSLYQTYFNVNPPTSVRLAPGTLNKLALKVTFSKIQPEIPGKINMNAQLVSNFFYNLADVLKWVDVNPNLKWLLVPDSILIFTDKWSYYSSYLGADPLPANVGIERVLESSLSSQTILKVVLTQNLTQGRWIMMMDGEAPISNYFKVYMSMAFMTYLTVKIEANALVFVNGQQVQDGDSIPANIGDTYTLSAYGTFSKWVVVNLDTLEVAEYEGVSSIELPANADYEVTLK